MKKALLLCALFLPSPALAVEIYPASPGEGGIAAMDSQIDWDQEAKRHFKAPDFDMLGEEGIRRMCKPEDVSFGNLELPFSAPLSDLKVKKYYYLLAPSGSSTLQPTALSGNATYSNTCHDPAVIGTPIFGGNLILARENGGDEQAGFVIATAQPVHFTVTTLDPDQLQRVSSGHYELREQGIAPVTGDDTVAHPPQAAVLYHVHIEEENHDYLFVQWAEDTQCDYGCCTYFTLFSVTDRLNPEAYSQFGCDV